MRASRWSSLIAWSGCLLLLMASTRVVAQEKAEPGAATAAEPAATTEPGAAAPAATPQVPPYFSGTNEANKPAVWPDPTGAGAGAWATPAGDGKGDIPA